MPNQLSFFSHESDRKIFILASTLLKFSRRKYLFHEKSKFYFAVRQNGAQYIQMQMSTVTYFLASYNMIIRRFRKFKIQHLDFTSYTYTNTSSSRLLLRFNCLLHYFVVYINMNSCECQHKNYTGSCLAFASNGSVGLDTLQVYMLKFMYTYTL